MITSYTFKKYDKNVVPFLSRAIADAVKDIRPRMRPVNLYSDTLLLSG